MKLSVMLPICLVAISLLAAAAPAAAQNTYCAGCTPCSNHNFAIQAFSSGQTGQIVVSNTNTQVGPASRAAAAHTCCCQRLACDAAAHTSTCASKQLCQQSVDACLPARACLPLLSSEHTNPKHTHSCPRLACVPAPVLPSCMFALMIAECPDPVQCLDQHRWDAQHRHHPDLQPHG